METCLAIWATRSPAPPVGLVSSLQQDWIGIGTQLLVELVVESYGLLVVCLWRWEVALLLELEIEAIDNPAKEAEKPKG